MSPQYLIKGDLSGIQKFIFNVLSDGAARSIRGRSFFLKIVLEVAMKAIFDKLKINDESEITRAKISTSGGNFILMVNSDPKDALQQIEAQFREAFQFIDISLILAYTEYMQGDYTTSIEQLDKNTREKKFQLLQNTQIQYFEPFEHHNIKIDNKNDKWAKWAIQIINQQNDSWNINKSSGEGNNILMINNSKLSFAGYEVEFTKGGKYKLKDYIESYNPHFINEKKQIDYKQFEDLADINQDIKNDILKSLQINIDSREAKRIKIKQQFGIDKLGVLAMDVDGLGAYFNHIQSPEEHKKFDKELNDFFNLSLRKLIETPLINVIYDNENISQRNIKLLIKEFDQRVYPVTAGGDDSYFVGNWQLLLKMAVIIKNEFLIAFKDRNNEIKKIKEINKDADVKELTITAAMIIVKPKFPVVRFVDLVDADLKKAKYDYPNSKGNFSLFGEVIKWEFLEKDNEKNGNQNDNKSDIEKLRKLFGQGISGGLLAKARITAKNIADNDGVTLADYWKMDYYLRQYNVKTKEEKKNNEKSKYEKISKIYSDNLIQSDKELAQVETASEQNKDGHKLRYRNYRLIFPIAARLAELDKR